LEGDLLGKRDRQLTIVVKEVHFLRRFDSMRQVGLPLKHC
jgi:hypothetical protein